MAAPQAVGAVVGENLRRLRKQTRLTQHELARLLQRVDSTWNRSKIAAIEAGERPNVSLADVLVLVAVLNVEAAEFFKGEGDIQLSEQLVIPREVVEALADGRFSQYGPDEWHRATGRSEILPLVQIQADRRQLGISRLGATEADKALAQRLSVSEDLVTRVAFQLWGHTLTDQRDLQVSLLGDLDANERQARRGHLTRELAQQVQNELVKRGHIPEVTDEVKEEQ